jgi:hypothetical protein
MWTRSVPHHAGRSGSSGSKNRSVRLPIGIKLASNWRETFITHARPWLTTTPDRVDAAIRNWQDMTCAIRCNPKSKEARRMLVKVRITTVLLFMALPLAFLQGCGSSSSNGDSAGGGQSLNLSLTTTNGGTTLIANGTSSSCPGWGSHLQSSMDSPTTPNS